MTHESSGGVCAYHRADRLALLIVVVVVVFSSSTTSSARETIISLLDDLVKQPKYHVRSV